MIQKQVVFNVGGALSSFLRIGDKNVVIDLGKNDAFNPVSDFLVPLSEKSPFSIDQLFLSHLDSDHISAVKEFDKNFFPEWWTAPCNNQQQDQEFHLNPDLVKNQNNECTDYVLQKMKGMTPGLSVGNPTPECPLNSGIPEYISLYHIPARVCENTPELGGQKYSNNTSLVLFIKVNGHTVFAPGDIMPEGFSTLLKIRPELKKQLNEDGVDFLIAPHHGLESSFSEELFQNMNGGKTRYLNIISEKIHKEDSKDGRKVHDKYRSGETCKGCNIDGEQAFSRKTSRGHIVIDFSGTLPSVKIIKTDDKEALIKEFL